MLSKQELDAALAAERAMYRALSEVQDITRELLDAVDRQDQVSVRLFLSMRQEGEALSLQVERNRALLERTLQADKALSRRLAGRESFYQS